MLRTLNTPSPQTRHTQTRVSPTPVCRLQCILYRFSKHPCNPTAPAPTQTRAQTLGSCGWSRAKLSDMGLSKQLVPEQSSFHLLESSTHGAGGSSGWQVGRRER